MDTSLLVCLYSAVPCLENVMCVLYFHELNENLESGPIYLYHSDCVFCRAQDIMDPVMNFKSRNPRALMVKVTY